MKGIKTRNWRLNVGGFAPYGTSYGLIWLQNVAQSWVAAMGDVIKVVNITSSVQPGPFSLRGRSEIWEALVTVWYKADENKLREHARRETQVLESRERELEERTMRRKHGLQQSLPHTGTTGQLPSTSSSNRGTTGGDIGGVGVGGGSVGDRSAGRLPGVNPQEHQQQGYPQQQQSYQKQRKDDDIDVGADQPSGSGYNRW